MRNASPRTQHAYVATAGRHTEPGRHRKTRSRAQVLGLPLVPTVGIAGALALVAGGAVAAASEDATTSRPTTSLAALAAGGTKSSAQDSLRASAADRADRTRAVQATAAARDRTARERTAWVAKAAASQRALAQKLSTDIATAKEIGLTATTLADKRAVAKSTAAKFTAVEAPGGVSTSGRYVLPVGSRAARDTFGVTGAHWANRHTGQDFPVPTGTGVRAVSSGQVIETGWAGAFGNRIKLLLDDGTEIWYCHLSSYVVTGGRVSVGEIVARSGSTGNSTGPHLHMEVHLNQNPVASDPLNWLRSKGLRI